MSKKILLNKLKRVDKIIGYMKQTIEATTLSAKQKTINIEALINNYRDDLLVYIKELIDVLIGL